MFGRVSFGKVAAVAAAFLALGLAGGCGEKSNPSSKDDTYKLTTVSNPSAGGTITAGGTYTAGDTVILTATAAAGYEFSSWTGAVGSGPITSVVMNGNKTVTANFTLKDDGGEDTTGGAGEKNGLVLGDNEAWIAEIECEDDEEEGLCLSDIIKLGLIFKADSSLISLMYIEALGFWVGGVAGTYSVNGDILTIVDADGESSGGPFSISGNTLTAYDPDTGEELTLTKTGGITYMDMDDLGDGMFKSPAVKKLPKALGKALSLSARK